MRVSAAPPPNAILWRPLNFTLSAREHQYTIFTVLTVSDPIRLTQPWSPSCSVCPWSAQRGRSLSPTVSVRTNGARRSYYLRSGRSQWC